MGKQTSCGRVYISLRDCPFQKKNKIGVQMSLQSGSRSRRQARGTVGGSPRSENSGP